MLNQVRFEAGAASGADVGIPHAADSCFDDKLELQA